MTLSIRINDRFEIDSGELSAQFVRSPGPGGQNVNKVNSKAIVHWDLGKNRQLPPEVVERIRSQAGNRINNDGCLVVSSHQSRNQAENLAFCQAKLRQIVVNALVPPKTRRPTRVSKAAKQRRITAKRQAGEKKAGRAKQNWNND